MRINPVNNINFNGRYRVLLTEDEFIQFRDEVLPKLEEQHQGQVSYIYGKTPMDDQFNEALDYYAKANGADYNWAVENVKHNGIRMQGADTSILWITTDGDSAKFTKYDNRRDLPFSINKLASFIRIMLADVDTDTLVAEIKATDEALNKESKAFYKYIKKHPFEKLKEADDVLYQDAYKIDDLPEEECE